jgi:hypothetical protein
MREVTVHFSRDEVEAEVAASALRAAGLHPRIARDDAGGAWGGSGSVSLGRRIVLVPEREAKRARLALGIPKLEEPRDQPLLRLVLIVLFIAGTTLGAALLAGSCAGSVGHVEVAAPADAGPLDERGQAALLASERVE